MLPAVDLGQLSRQLPPADETSPPVDSFNCNNTHRMLPKNESLRKILVVFSFFETFCTRVGNSERFGQGESSLSYFFSDFPRWCDGGCGGGVENVVILTFGRLLDGGRIEGWKWQGVN